jgi:hypothetical protein
VKRPAGEHRDLVYGNNFQTKQAASSKTDELGSNAEKGRSASVGKIFNGRTKYEEMYRESRLKPDRRYDNGNFTSY